ncbi:MAG: hypothetical protein WBN04_01740 [Paracoccaceae bacterium]
MADAGTEPDVRKLVQSIRKTNHNFAVLIGKSGLVFEADKRRPPAALKKKAKESGGGAKGAMGTAHFEGSLLVLKCEEEPPRQLLKLMKKFLLENGVNNKVSFKFGDADDHEDDKEADKKSAAPDKHPTTGAEDPAKEQGARNGRDKKSVLDKAYAGLKPEILDLMKIAGAEQKAQLQTLIKTFGEGMKRGEFDHSEATLARLQTSLGDIKTRRAEGTEKRKSELTQIRARAGAVLTRLKGLRETRRAG